MKSVVGLSGKKTDCDPLMGLEEVALCFPFTPVK